MTHKLILTSSLLALALAACSSNPAASIPQGPSTALTSNLTQDKAVAQKSQLQDGVKGLAGYLAAGGSAKLASVSSTLPASAQALMPATVGNLQPLSAGRVGVQKTVNLSINCKVSGTITYEGDDSDADSDGIVLKSIWKVNNCSDKAGEFLNGQFVAQDKDDNDAKSGYLVLLDATSQYGQLVYGVDFSPKGNGAYDLKFGFKAAGANSDFVEYGYTLNYVAKDPAKPFAAGTLNASGKFGLKSGAESFVFNLTGTNLIYDKAVCASDFIGGTGTYTDSNSNKVEITYTGCSTSSAKHNNTAI